jgi:hypothetical protein
MQDLLPILSPEIDVTDLRSFCWGNANFTSAWYYKFIFDSLPDHPTMRHIWKSKCLPKLRVFVWLLIMDRLNTKDIMSRKHWQVDGGLNCVLCNLNVRETRDHLFFDCPFVINCWNQLSIVWNNNLLISARILKSKQVFGGPCFIEVFACATWNFWKIRNDYIFRGQIPSFRRWKVRFLSDLDLHKFRVKPSVVQPLSDWSRSCFLYIFYLCILLLILFLLNLK